MNFFQTLPGKENELRSYYLYFWYPEMNERGRYSAIEITSWALDARFVLILISP